MTQAARVLGHRWLGKLLEDVECEGAYEAGRIWKSQGASTQTWKGPEVLRPGPRSWAGEPGV